MVVVNDEILYPFLEIPSVCVDAVLGDTLPTGTLRSGEMRSDAQRGYVFLLVFTMACGCASSRPAYLDNPSLHPRFPKGGFLTYVGVSRSSGREAELLAKTGVSAQVKSSLVSELEALEQDVCSQQRCRSMQMSRQEVHETSTFSKAEMISIDPSAGGYYDGRYYAFAFLPRRAALKVLVSEYENSAVGFRESAGIAFEARDLPAFTAAFRSARRQVGMLMQRIAEIRIISGREGEDGRSDLDLWRKLLQEREHRLASVTVSVAVDMSSEGDSTARLSSGVARALATLGVKTVTEGDCRGELELRLRPRLDCRQGAFGPYCVLALKGTLRDCGAKTVLAEVDLSDPAFAATSPRGEDFVRQQVWNTVTDTVLRKRLMEALSSSIPLD